MRLFLFAPDNVGVILRGFLKKYTQADAMADFKGFRRYHDNKWEKKAENWARQEYRKKWKNKY